MTINDFVNYLENLGCDVDAVRDEIFHLELTYLPVNWNSRLRSSAGMAHCSSKNPSIQKIDLNPNLRAEGAQATFLVFVHELAHIIAGARHGHDRVWQRICLALGGDGLRCHNFETMKRTRQATKVVAECDTCGHKIHRRKMLAKDRIYMHKTNSEGVPCGGMLFPVRG